MSSDQSPPDSTSFKVAFIGAGSIGFTRKLVGDILTVPEFAGIELAFMDISEQNLSMVERLVRRDLEANGLHRVRLTGTLDQREAVSGARYVFCTARIGGLPAFATDIEVPLRYGIDQCVGDTLCAGGIMYGQRGIPVILALCKDIREAAEPGCRFFNYSNPMAMLTWAANRYGGVPTVGLCHGVQGGHTQIADALGIPADELDYRAAGINHQTWYIQLLHRGRDVSGELLAAYERHPVYRETEKVRIEMLRRFGCYSTESNGHLSEYVPWFRKRPDEIRDWIDMSSWDPGRDRRLPARFERAARLVRGGLPPLDGRAAGAIHAREPLHRARLLHPGGAGDRARLPRPLQRREPRLHHQPAGRRLRRGAGLRRPHRPAHLAGGRPAARLRRRLQRQHLRAAARGRGRDARRRAAAGAGHDDGPRWSAPCARRRRSRRWSTTC